MTGAGLLLAFWLRAAAAADDPVAAVGPIDALIAPVRALYVDGRSLEAKGELDRAAARYRRVLELEPSWTQALLDLGRVYEAMGETAHAEQTYQRAPYDADVVEALADLYLETDRPERAARLYAQLRDLRPETPEFLVPEARATAAFDPLAADGILREYLDRPGAAPASEGVVTTASEIARALRETGEEERAAALLDHVVVRLGDADDTLVRTGAMAAFEALRDRFAVEEEARALAEAADVPLIPSQQAELRAARERFAAGEVDDAERRLRAILEETPNNAETWAALSDVLEHRGDIAGAETAIRMAEGLAPVVAAYPARLGDLLSEHYGGRFEAEAALAYGRAVQRQGASPELWYRRAAALQRAGVPDRAIASFERYLEAVGEGPLADRARAAIAGWARVRPEPPIVPVAPGRPPSVPEAAWEAHHVAHVLAIRADGDRAGLQAALAELQTARALAPDYVRSMNLEAAIRREFGELDAARALYRRSLELDPAQPDVLTELAALDRRAGDLPSAEARLVEAARLGSAAALLDLAREDVARWRLWSARGRLDAYFASTTSGVAYDEAVALAAEVEQRIRGLVVLGAGLLLVGGALPIVVRWRRRSGQPLEALLRASPAAWREVARIASAIRHEVLKHHTTVLASVADALEDHDVEPARWAADKLYGEHGAIAKFRAYVEQLRLLGAVHGVRLNLRHRDPVLGPLIEAMEELAAIESELRSGANRRLPDALRDLSQVLNRTGYRGLGALIRRVCVLELDEPLLREIWDEVRREPAQRGAPEIDLELVLPPPGERIWVRVFRGDLQDILTNLLRNALAASAEVGSARLRLVVEGEEDDITGLERVAIRVADDGPRRISTAMIRGRYIGRGLGLAVDLVSRSGGSVHVEDEPGWSKAVVVRLPRAELADGEAEEEG